MKVTLCLLSALILLSSIASIFNNLVVGDVSAQQFQQQGADEMYTGYENSVPSMYEKNNPNEYSSYNNYQPTDYGKAYASSYKEGYDNTYNTVDDKYSESPTEEYKYECRTGPLEGFFVSSVEFCKNVKFDDKDDRKDNKIGPQGLKGDKGPKGDKGDTGARGPAGSVDIFQCPAGSNLGEGANVTNLGLCQAPNDDNLCPADTDLENVYVDNPPDDCDIFATCPAGSPLTVSLNLTRGETIEVADPKLCNLDVPEQIGLDLIPCPADTNNAGALVTNATLCEAPNDDNICPADTDLENVYVNNPPDDCDIFETCQAGSPLTLSLNLTRGTTVEVADLQLCELSVPEVELCGDDTESRNVFVENAPEDCNVDVDVSFTNSTQAQCLKCGDLSVFAASGGNNAGQNLASTIVAAGELRGVPPTTPTTPTNTNIFTVCDDPTTAKAEFDDRVTNAGVVDAFEACVDDAAITNPESPSFVQGQAASLQEDSLITNVEPQAEIPSLNTGPHNPDLNALLEHPNVKALLENPDLNALLENPDPNALLENPNVKALLESPEVNALLEDSSVKTQIENQ